MIHHNGYYIFHESIVHDATGETINFTAIVRERKGGTGFWLKFSHTFIAIEGGNPWFSDAYTTAIDIEDAESRIQEWIERLTRAYRVLIW